MSGLVPRDFIRELLDRVDIIDVIDAHVPLKKKGANHQACCPFHQEKTPSFTVSQPKQFFHCFGCGAHGNALDFVMQFDQLSFVDAIEELARLLGVEVPREQMTPAKAAKAKVQKDLYAYLQQAQRFFQWQLRQPSGAVAVEYLKSRGILGKTAQRFALGFAGEGWDALQQHLGQTSADVTALLQAGLLIENEHKRVYDRFRERVIFPIRDARGRTLGFGGRTLDPDGVPKYLNSPETPVYQKGHHLYGLYEAIQDKATQARMIVVEGYMDVIALVQHGLSEVVAALGTAFTQQQLRLLTKHSQHIIFCFDGDAAGQQAAWRALNMALPIMTGQYRIDFLLLPPGEDPDSLVKQEGLEAFEQRLTQAISFSDYFWQHYKDKHHPQTLDSRATCLTDMLPALRKIPHGGFLSLLVDHLAQQLQTSPESLLRDINQQTTPMPQLPVKQLSFSERALAYLIQHPGLAQKVAPPQNPTPQGASEGLLMRVWTFLADNPGLHTGQVLAEWSDETDRTRLGELAQVQLSLDVENLLPELQGIAAKLQVHDQRQALADLIAASKNRVLTPTEKRQLQKLLVRK